MTVEEKREDFVKRATNYFREGLNCSECVLKAYLDNGDSGFDPSVIALASGFGRGIGETSDNTCGSLIGGCLVLGAICGRKNPLALETPRERLQELNNEIYPKFYELSTEFKKVFGTTICHEMVKGYIDQDGIERKRNCKKAIGVAAEIVAKYIYP